MSIKSFSFGLGLGITFVSLVSVVLIRTEVSRLKAENVNEVPVEMSDEEIIERAKELGLVSLTELPDKKSTQQDTKKDNQIEENSVGNSEAETEAVTEKTAEEVSDNQQTGSHEENTGRTVAFTITSGESARMVSEALQEKGLVDNAEDFKAYIIQKGVAKKLSTGSFSIPEGSDYDTIIEIIRDKK